MNRPTNPLTPIPAPSSPPAGRLWLFRGLAGIGLPLLLLGVLEGGLQFAGYGRDARFLIPDKQPGFYRSNPDFVRLFMPAGFDLRPLNFRLAARKPPDTVRIFVLGESAAQGVPEPAFAFAPQLRAQLRARHPGKNFEVINTGIVAINSHVIRQIAHDLAGFSPDLFVVYMGNNEVVGPYGPGCSYLDRMPPLWIIRLGVFVRTSRTGQLLGAMLAGIGGHNTPSAWGGMAMFAESAVRGDDPRLEKVHRNFEANLEDIVRTAAAAGAKTVLCTVVSNLKDCPPLLSLHRPDLSADELSAWTKVYERGRINWLLGDNAAARPDLLAAWRLDPQHADTAYLLGSLALQAGDTPAAREYFLAAQHWDALRFRPDPQLNAITRRVAARHATATLVDGAVLLGSDPDSTVPPAGREVLFEHVHLDWEGNHQLALALARGVEAALPEIPPTTQPWLDSAGCARALARTPAARVGVLQKISTITRNPPFPNQLTYPEDMARFARDLTQAQADRGNPALLHESWQTAEAALAGDPDNPAVVKTVEELAEDRGDTEAALKLARRSREMQPDYFRLAADEAMKLAQVGRFDEAERLLQQTAAACAARELTTVAPAFVDLAIRTRRFAEIRHVLDSFLTRLPGDPTLGVLRAQLARLAGDTATAESELRATLAAHPGHQGALEELVALLLGAGRTQEAEQASLAAAEQQAGNQANNFRAALAAEARTDEAAAVKHYLAAERSGPVTAAVELRLARKLTGLDRTEEALLHLAWARRLSQLEGNPAVTRAISEYIDRLRAATP